MELILDFVKNYLLFMLVLYLISYLAPKEEYRRYFRFFIGALMIVVLMKPVLGLLKTDVQKEEKMRMDAVMEQMSENRYEEKGEDIFEWFSAREGVDDKALESEE